VLYDYETDYPIGTWNEEKKCIDEIEMEDEEDD
jgi:hypothetical protein